MGRNAVLDDSRPIGSFESLDLNIFTTVEFLNKTITPRNSPILFKYRIKEWYNEATINSSIHIHGSLPPIFSFEISAMNLFSLTSKSCLLMQNPEETILFKHKDSSDKYTLEMANDLLATKAFQWAENQLGVKTSKCRTVMLGEVEKDRVISAYVDMFYELEKARDFLNKKEE